MGVEILQCAVLGQQLDGRLVADALDAGDVVADVADEGLIVHNLIRPDAQIGHDAGRVIDLGAAAGLARWEFDARVVVHQLQQVAVAGDDVYRDLVAHLPGDGAQHVVGLEALALQNGDVQGADDLLDARDLHVEFVGHLLARALVLTEQVIAKRRAQVEADGQVVRRVVTQDEVE